MTNEKVVKRGFRFTEPNHPMHVYGKVHENPTYVVTRVAQGVVYYKMVDFMHFVPVDEDKDRFLEALSTGKYLPVEE